MHRWAASHVTFLCWNRRTLVGTRAINSATVFFLRLDDRLFAVTAGHVLDGYQEAKAKSGKSITCQIGNIPFDPISRLRSRGTNKDIDVAIFDLTWEELARIGKQAVLGAPWPPTAPSIGQGVFLVGFPAKLRFWLDPRSISFGLYSGFAPISQITETELTSAFEREFWVSSEGERLPPHGLDLGGLSGGPVLLPLEHDDGTWDLALAGVITHAVFNEVVYAMRAELIRADGALA